MALQKITEKTTAAEVKDDAHVLITQPEQQEGGSGGEVESLRRAPVAEIAKKLGELLKLDATYLKNSDFDEMKPNIVKNVEATETGIRITFWNDEDVEIPIESGGLAFDSVTYDQESGYLHIQQDGEDVVDPCFIGGGGGGSSSGTVVKLENTTGASALTVAYGEDLTISFTFYDYDGSEELTNSSGALELSVNGSVVVRQNIEQGSHSYNIGQYLVEGTNKVKIKVTDEDDNYATKTWTVTAVALSVSASFDDTAIYDGAILFRYTPIGNNIEKKIHFLIDESEVATATVTASNRQQTQTIPAQSHGAHRLKVYADATVEGVTVKSNVLEYDVICVEEGNPTPIIACSFTGKAKQYTTVSIPYIVYTPLSLYSNITLAVDGETVSTLTVGRTRQVWSYKPETDGVKTLTITTGEVYEVAKTIMLEVEPIGIDIEPVTTGLVFDLNPAGHTNNENNRDSFGYTDAEGENHPLTFSPNFDWMNGGFQTDADGNTYFCIKCGTYVTADCSLFADDATRSGKALKFIFRATNCRNYDAQILSCMADNIGVSLQAQRATVRSQLTAMEVPYCEDSMIEMDVNIEPDSEDKAMMIWLEGVPSKVAIYADNDNFTQDNPAMLRIGSDDCDVHIYRVKAYQNSLSRLEIHENWMADAPNAEEMLERYNRNNIFDANGNVDINKLIEASPELRVIVIDADRMTTAKSDKVTCSVTHTYKAGGDAHCFTASNVTMKAQGTSSAQYGEAALNLDLEFSDGFEFDSGDHGESYAMTENSIGVNYFNVKLNVASSENANNVILADEYNLFQPYKNPARQADPKVRDTIEGHPCVVFYHNTSGGTVQVGAISVKPDETILYGCGDMNNSKKNLEVFGQKDNPKQCCIELLNNTSNITLWKSDDLRSETWDGEGALEFRYPDEPTQDMKQAFQRVLSWVVSTDRTAASNRPLPEAKTYGGQQYTTDTADYRAAKFVAELDDYFIKDSVLFHYLFTERHAMVDNRAKNVFVSTDDGLHWDFTKDYDNDTADGNDNEGGLTLSYGLEDTDQIGTKDVFNAASSVLWCNVRDLLFDDLRAMFLTLESQGAWQAERILAKFEAHQAPRPEALVIEDMWKKYIRPYTNSGTHAYLDMMYGTKKDQRRQFEIYQEKYISSKYRGSTATSDTITFRAYTPVNWSGVAPSDEITITPYADMYITLQSGSGIVTVRSKRNEPHTLKCPIDTLNDTEIYIYTASMISSVGDLAPLYIGYFNIAAAVKLRELKIGDGTEGYANTNATTIGLGNNNLLEKLDLQNLPNLRQTLDLTGCDALLDLKAKGSGLTGVSFAPGGKIKTAEIPAVSLLSAISLNALESLTISSYEALRTLRVENCPTIDVKEWLENATGLTRVRIIGVDWVLLDTTLLDAILAMKGLDESDHNIEQSVLTGRAHVPTIRQSRLDAYERAWTDFEVSYETLIAQYLVSFVDWDDDPLYSEYVDRNSDAEDPVETGKIDTPTRESTESTVYTYSGWDSPLTNILGPKTIRAQYSETPRKYQVRWLQQAGVVLKTVEADYGTEAVYDGDEPQRTDEEEQAVYYLFNGWDKSTGRITGNVDVYAVWQRGELPVVGAETSVLSAAQVYAIKRSANPGQYFDIKDRVTVQFGYDPQFSNIPFEDIIDEPTSFDGKKTVETSVKPFENGIADAWTLVADLEFVSSTQANQTLISCFQEEGTMGFKIFYNGGPAVLYGADDTNAAHLFRTNSTTYRELMVLRHEAGSRNLKVYSSMHYTDTIGYVELEKTVDPQTAAPIVLGALKGDDGEFKDYATGTIHSLRMWKGDLGDTECRKLACWVREEYEFETGGHGQYKLAVEEDKDTAVDFICAGLLAKAKQQNTTNTNAGGMPETALFKWMQNRLLNGMAEPWRKVLSKCKVKHNNYVDGSQYDIQTSEAMLWLPAAGEMQSMATPPWSYEGEWVTFFTSNNERIKWLGLARPENSTMFGNGTDPSLDESSGLKEGDVWIGGGGYFYWHNGKWIASSYFWLRGATVANSANFCNVYSSGGVNTGGNNNGATNSYGVCPRFSI